MYRKIKRNRYTEYAALEALKELEHVAREGIEVCQHGRILLPRQMQVDRMVDLIRGFLNGEEKIEEVYTSIEKDPDADV